MKKYYTEQTDRAAAIIVIRESYERTASGRGWRSVPYETEIKQASFREYKNCVESIGFWRDRVLETYTYYGYVPTRLTSISPDHKLKTVRRFKFFRTLEEARQAYPGVEFKEL